MMRGTVYRKAESWLAVLFLAIVMTACNSGGKYEVKDGTVYFTYWTFSFGTQERELQDVDIATFESMKNWLARDSHHVWYKDQLVEGADPATAEADDYPLFHDKRDYYYEGKAIGVADIQSFKVLKCDEDELWAVDKQYVYFDSLRIDDSDPATLELIGTFEAKDKRHIYYFGRILEGADPETYQILDGNYAKDSKHVWFCGDIIEDADVETFEAESTHDFEKPDAHDKHGDFRHGKRIEGKNQ